MNVRRLCSTTVWKTCVWWRSRPFRLLILALPALVAGLGVFSLVAATAMVPTQELEARYLIEAEQALKRKDYAKALTCYERLAYRGTERPEVLYGMAQAAEALEKHDQAAMLMAELAPVDRVGYGPAHIWQAHRLLRTPNLSLAQRKAAESHLLHALDAHVEDSGLVHNLLCELYVLDAQPELALTHLLKAINSRPQLRLRAAQLYAMRGDKQRAHSEGEMAVAYFRGRTTGDSADHFARLAWADALTFLERFSEAVTVLRDGFTLSHDSVYSIATGRVYAAWYDTLVRTPDSDAATRLTILEKGLQHDPNNRALLERLLTTTKLSGGEGEQARLALHKLLALGQASATVHFALGVDALQQGQADQARLHWERAIELSPRMPEVANNLAWMIASSDNADLPRALGLANAALEIAPNESNFRHTRGNILFKMGRYKEALKDFETALPRYADDPELHAHLADTYERLGDSAMAAEHRRLSQIKPAKQPVAPPRKL